MAFKTLVITHCYLVCLYIHCCYGYPPLELSVEGAYRTGANTYTVSTDLDNYYYYYYNYNYVTILCASNTVDPGSFALIRNGNVIKTTEEDDQISFEINVNELGNPETFSCVLKQSVKTADGITFNFEMTSYMNIETVSSDVPFCTTSFGTSVFNGEEVEMYCFGAGVRWVPEYSDVVSAIIGTSNTQMYTCESPLYFDVSYYLFSFLNYPEPMSNQCQLSLDILPSLTIAISPTTFSHTSDMEFNCIATPHRLVYWDIYGSEGNLLDENFANLFLSVSTNITIDQTDKKSTLRISESVMRGNGIHTVLCYTYDTIRQSAMATVQVKPSVTTEVKSPSVASSTSTTPSGNSAVTLQDVVAVTSLVLIVLLTIMVGTLLVIFILCRRKTAANESAIKQDQSQPKVYLNQSFQPQGPNTVGTAVPVSDGQEYNYIDPI